MGRSCIQPCQKLSRVVGNMYKYRHIIPFKKRYPVYNSLFCSKYNYCFFAWGNTTATNIKLMHTLQK
ncbi:unnamed protein product, partial [Ixodes hexagonus]